MAIFVDSLHVKKRLLLTTVATICVFFSTFGQIPAGYYDAAVGKSGRELQAALSGIIDHHTVLTYGSDNPGGLWHAFRTTDVRPDGTVWDIYSNCVFIPWEDGHISAAGECVGGTQQEHTFCQSWMNYSSTPLYSDMFHIYPVDAWVNGRRSNHPYGEVPDEQDLITRLFQNGAKLGYNGYISEDYESFCSQVYEPIDEYKGDIARGFFYIATRYMFEDSEFSESYGMTVKSQLRPWALSMMRKWNRQDTVSQKELNRNNLIFNQFQHNRNPYIDFPELVELVFGADSLYANFHTECPRAPQNLTVTPDTSGRLFATLSWENPSVLLNGELADTLLSVKIFRDGVQIFEIHHPSVGQWMTWTDYAVPTARSYEYRVLATTSAGNGLTAVSSAFVGQSCPLIVRMFDEADDGWQGPARIEFQNMRNERLSFIRMACGEEWGNTYTLPLPADSIQCVWIPGTRDYENAFILSHSFADTMFAAQAVMVYDSATASTQLHSDVEQFDGVFFTFVNDACPLDEVPCRVFDTLEMHLSADQLPYLYGPAQFLFTANMLDNPFYTYHVSGTDDCDSIITVQFSVDNATYAPMAHVVVEISPNPTTGKLFLHISNVENGEIQLFNVAAQPLMNMQCTSGIHELDISSFAKGVYLVKIRTATSEVVKKVILR